MVQVNWNKTANVLVFKCTHSSTTAKEMRYSYSLKFLHTAVRNIAKISIFTELIDM